MVDYLLVAFLFVTIRTSFAANTCTEGSEFEPPLCPLVLPWIEKVTITENAAKAFPEQNISVTCTSFSIKEAQVRRYFSKAKITNENDAHYTLDWSPCYARGKIFFSDGRTGDWRLNQFQMGSLVINKGRKLVLYCPQCKFKPFKW